MSTPDALAMQDPMAGMRAAGALAWTAAVLLLEAGAQLRRDGDERWASDLENTADELQMVARQVSYSPSKEGLAVFALVPIAGTQIS